MPPSTCPPPSSTLLEEVLDCCYSNEERGLCVSGVSIGDMQL